MGLPNMVKTRFKPYVFCLDACQSKTTETLAQIRERISLFQFFI